MKKIIKKSVSISVFLVVFSGIISCEKDFTDIGTTIITNNVFSTDKILVDIELENKEVDRIRTDNVTLEPGQYLLGVYNSADYEKLEASILSQVGTSNKPPVYRRRVMRLQIQQCNINTRYGIFKIALSSNFNRK